MVKQSNKSQLS